MKVRIPAKPHVSFLCRTFFVSFVFLFCLFFNHIFPCGLFPFVFTADALRLREVFAITVFLVGWELLKFRIILIY